MESVYAQLSRDLEALLEGTKAPWETRLSTLIALLKERLPKISWVGAYLERPAGSGTLWIDAYQGKVACLEIPPGKGVCGAAFLERKTLIVPDVEKFPGHIACDAASRSEIVLPLYREKKLVGVLDLDSHALAAFTTEDQIGIEKLLSLLSG